MRARLRSSQVTPGAFVEVEGRPRLVVGTLRFTSEGRRWEEHCVEGETAGSREWVAIRPRNRETVVEWETRHDLVAEPDLDGITLDGRDWILDEAGTATYTATGDTGTGPDGTCDFVEYTSGSEAVLVFESFDGSVWELSTGRRVDPERVIAYHDVPG
jgi:hypothetical protein